MRYIIMSIVVLFLAACNVIQPSEQSIIGTWQVVAREQNGQVEQQPESTSQVYIYTPDGILQIKDTTSTKRSFTWKLQESVLTLTRNGDENTVVQFQTAFPDRDTLRMTNEDGAVIVFKRQP